MTEAMYDPRYIREYFDQLGRREWERLEASPSQRASFHVHAWYLVQFIKPGDHVLEAGAGPGRFTRELAKLGARVTVGDISPEQLALNRATVEEAGVAASVTAWEILDITDLTRFPPGSFDAVVCYGEPLSYVCERADVALAELLRVTRPGGHVLLSVIALLGAARDVLRGVVGVARQYGLGQIEREIATGDLHGDTSRGHRCHMYRWTELEALLERQPCTIVAASAANFLSVGNDAFLEEVRLNEPELWDAILRWEVEFGREPGALDAGTHLIAVVRREESLR